MVYEARLPQDRFNAMVFLTAVGIAGYPGIMQALTRLWGGHTPEPLPPSPEEQPSPASST
jgi:hypothetical protein